MTILLFIRDQFVFIPNIRYNSLGFFKFIIPVSRYAIILKGNKAVPEKKLTFLIEKKRAELIQIAGKFGFCSPAAISRSQELDLLLNEYQRLQLTNHNSTFSAKKKSLVSKSVF